MSADWLTARLTHFGVIGLLLAILAMAVAQNFASLRSFDVWVESFGKPIVRESYRAISDVGTLQNAIHSYYPTYQGAPAGPQVDLTMEQRQRLSKLIDMVWVRADQITTLDVPEMIAPKLDAALTDLNHLVDLADLLLAKPDHAYETVAQFHAHSEEVRLAFSRVVEHWRAKSVFSVKSSLYRLNMSVWISNGFAIAATLLAAIAFRLLSQEVRTRKAKEEAEEEASRLAYFDSLTELPNRVSFNATHAEWAARCEKKGSPYYLALMDLDKFKDINDTLGHEAGDRVLRAQAKRIEAIVKENGGFAARLSGDEFAALLPFDRTLTATMFCRDLARRLAKPVDYNKKRIDTAGSVGVCAASRLVQKGQLDKAALTRAADFALYDAKSEHSGNYRVFDDELAERLAKRSAMSEALPQAIKQNEIEAFFQPKVDIETGRPLSFEALARWRRGDRIIMPGEFIDVAEEAGLIGQIDLAVLEHAATVIADCNRRHNANLSISTNLSAKHFLRFDIVEAVKDVLQKTGLPAELLVLEITETKQLSDWNTANRSIRALRKLGCSISIDDFGTGYSSLSYLRAVEADEVKVDRSFVIDLETSMEAQFLLDAIIDIASELGMKTVVEGIETEEQARLVHSMGCRVAQGYLYSKPVPTDQLDDIFANNFIGPLVLEQQSPPRQKHG